MAQPLVDRVEPLREQTDLDPIARNRGRRHLKSGVMHQPRLGDLQLPRQRTRELLAPQNLCLQLLQLQRREDGRRGGAGAVRASAAPSMAIDSPRFMVRFLPALCWMSRRAAPASTVLSRAPTGTLYTPSVSRA
jgi:hypothetical protein